MFWSILKQQSQERMLCWRVTKAKELYFHQDYLRLLRCVGFWTREEEELCFLYGNFQRLKLVIKASPFKSKMDKKKRRNNREWGGRKSEQTNGIPGSRICFTSSWQRLVEQPLRCLAGTPVPAAHTASIFFCIRAQDVVAANVLEANKHSWRIQVSISLTEGWKINSGFSNIVLWRSIQKARFRGGEKRCIVLKA